MLLFQQFCLNNPAFMTSTLKNGAWPEEDDAESAEEDNEEDIENLPVYQCGLEGNLTTLLENVGTNVSAAVTPSKASRKLPSKIPRKSPAKKSRSTPIKSPKKGALPSFLVKQKTPEKKKSARELLKEKVATKKAAKSTELSTPASSPKKSAKELLKTKVAAKKSAAVKTNTKTVVRKVNPPAKKVSTTIPKKKK
ncbi:hypothetical protein TrLO_g6659 [Triparma laevis f. longispina]|uniref:Uncharacterized protein n=1 Tax=Triparma laevis f. longispina TaxID=1714387 RepID=A0A9W7E3B9_9STRA|nr:hypothetical protein TrLO_g6659 [Triparma laevis f. longispina]